MTTGCGRWTALREGITYYERHGAAPGPWVVLVHGFSVPAFVWDRTVPALVDAGWQVLRFDLYGRGASGKPAGRYDLTRFVGQVWDLVDAVLGNTAVVLVGYSMGGPIVAAAAQARPAQTRAVGLLAPVVTGVRLGPALRALAVPGLGPWLMRTFGRARMEQGIRADFHGPADEAYVRRYMAQWHDPGFARALAASVRAGMLGDFRPVFAALGRLGKPVWAAWGQEDTLVPPEQLTTLQALVPGLQSLTVPRVGHLLHYEQAPTVNAHLVAWLQHLPS